jgi:phosphoribosyl-ATP pyrophosphohydrolase
MTDISILHRLEDIIQERKNDSPETSYTAQLFQAGLERTSKKIGEESTEVVIAALTQDNTALIGEIGDLIYHLSVLMAQKNVTWSEVADILSQRLNISGLEEKAARKGQKNNS